eukprot:TRINITY_DN6369_c0_g1_i1.p1 TRINITY_DN6369_c0_g1~~TRINITY_DN6369_c0_g1_i1.p1  ORF type:complete len:843 (-),score=151.13 TRINITY_DN6369_c0_g1_i1:63-2591(-)
MNTAQPHISNLDSILKKLADYRDTFQPENELIGLQELNSVRTLIQLLVCWGIIPRLHNGVGIPLIKRSKVVQQNLDQNYIPTHEDDSILVRSLKTLMSLLNIEPTRKIILHNHLTDLFSGLLQIIYVNEDGNGLRSNEDAEFSESALKHLQETVEEQHVMESLMLLLANSGAPGWFRTKCSNILSQCLLRQFGLSSLLHILLGSSDQATPKLYEKAVKIITTFPKQTSREEYYRNISQQLVPLYSLKGQKYEHITKSAALITTTLMEQDTNLGRKHLLSQITKSLGPIMNFNYIGKLEDYPLDDELVSREEDVEQTIINLSVLIHYGNPKPKFYQSLHGLLPTLLRLYFFARSSRSFLGSRVRDVLVPYLKNGDNAILRLKNFFVNTNNTVDSFLAFAPGPTGGATIQRRANVRDLEVEAKFVVDLLVEMKESTPVGNFFVEMLQEYQWLLERQNSGNLPEEETSEQHARYLGTVAILAEMSDRMEPFILSNVVHICSFVKLMLESPHKDDESIRVSFRIISIFLDGLVTIKKEEELLLFDLLPILEELSRHSSDALAEKASSLRLRILTRDKSWANPSPDVDDDQKSHQSSLENILGLMNDPLTAVRVHGLIELRRAVLEKNPLVVKNLPRVLELFRVQLQQEDSSLYLTAINGIAAIGDVAPDQTIPYLVDMFKDKDLNVLTRLKIGECLVKVATRCGETLPVYGGQFVGVFLEVSDKDDEDEFVRGSSLSNLASVCEVLAHAVKPFIYRILQVILSLLQPHRRLALPAQVKRGAVYVINRLLFGCGVEIVEIAPDQLSAIYHCLKNVRMDGDEITGAHAEEGLSFLGQIARTLISPSEQ